MRQVCCSQAQVYYRCEMEDTGDRWVGICCSNERIFEIASNISAHITKKVEDCKSRRR